MAKASVAPTLNGRIETLDAIRGIAILGILLANIAAFAQPEFGARLTGDFGARSHPTELFTLVFVNGKFRSMLALLFGAGVALQYAKRTEAGASWPGSYLRRTFFLAMIGLSHYLAIWYGDILFPYAIIAAIVSVFALMPDTVRRVLSVLSVAVSGFLMVGLVVLTLAFASASKMFSGTGVDEAARETRVFQTGTYAEQITYRLDTLPAVWMSFVFVVIAVTPLFLVGFELGRSGVLADPERGRRVVRLMATGGLALGLPLNLVLLLPFWKGHPAALELCVEFVAGPTLSVGYFGAIVLWVWSGRAAALRRRLQDIGRMALSNYLLQSLLCTTLFYSWGFARFGRWDGYALWGVVLGVWAANVAFTQRWLRSHRMGPVEWLWRCASEGRRFPLRRAAEPAGA